MNAKQPHLPRTKKHDQGQQYAALGDAGLYSLVEQYLARKGGSDTLPRLHMACLGIPSIDVVPQAEPILIVTCGSIIQALAVINAPACLTSFALYDLRSPLHELDQAYTALTQGHSSYTCSTSEHLVAAWNSLSRNQRSVATHYIQGLKPQKIALEMNTEPSTISEHFSRIRTKLNLSRTEDLLVV